MTNDKVRELLKRYNNGNCTDSEKALLEKWYMELGDKELDISLGRIDEIKLEVLKNLPGSRGPIMNVKLWQGLVAIASIVLLTVGTWQLFLVPKVELKIVTAMDVHPGGNKATLVLSDGRKIDLNSKMSAIVAGPGGVSYADNGASIVSGTGRQKLVTPRGGQYQLVLSDGTKVWLNAASSISYPGSFALLKERRVEITGEAYFEVAHNPSIPFRVVSGGQTVEVLGTHFNINSYNDNKGTVTTLAQGSVRVSNGSGNWLVLKPGQKSVFDNNMITAESADLETELAWKNGTMEFRDAKLRDILMTVSRWYDIDIEYRGKVPDRAFTGSVPRTSDLSVLLRILEHSDVHFALEGNGGGFGKKLVLLR